MGGLGILGLLVVATTVEFQDGGEILQGPDPSNLSGTAAWYFGTIDTFTRSYSSSEPNSADNPHGNDSGNDEDRLKIEDENGATDQSPYCHTFVRMPIIQDWILPESVVSEAKLFIYLYRENSNLQNTYAQDNGDTDITDDEAQLDNGGAGPGTMDNYRIDLLRQPWGEDLTWNQEHAWLPADLQFIAFQDMHSNTAASHYTDDDVSDTHEPATETYDENTLQRNSPAPVEYDITAAVQAWLAGTEENLGVRLSLRDDDGTSKAELSFRSAEWCRSRELATCSLKLQITYDDSSATPSQEAPVVADALVRNYNASSDYGTSPSIIVQDAGGDEEEIFIQFDLSGVSVPAGKVVSAAYAKLAAHDDSSGSDSWIQTDLVLEDWDETGAAALTWDNSRGLSSYKLSSGRGVYILPNNTESDASPCWLYFDATQAARLWFTQPLGNFGVRIRGDASVATNNAVVRCHSRENTSGTGDEFDPRLVVTFRAEAGTPPTAQIDVPDPGTYTTANPFKMLPGSLDLDGSGSTGTSLLHHWTVVDAGGAAQSAVGATASVVLSTSGLYDVYLVVAEPDGETDMAQLEAETVRVLTAAEWPPDPTAIDEIDLTGTLTDDSGIDGVMFVRAEVGGTEVVSAYVGTGWPPRPWSLDVTGLSAATGTLETIDVKATDASGNTATLQLVVDMKELQF